MEKEGSLLMLLLCIYALSRNECVNLWKYEQAN